MLLDLTKTKEKTEIDIERKAKEVRRIMRKFAEEQGD